MFRPESDFWVERRDGGCGCDVAMSMSETED
jgi:hypothetical protein